MKRIATLFAALLCTAGLSIIAVLIAGCTAKDYDAERVIPQAPDYSDASFWITEDADPKGTGADVFYVVSTWEVDWKDAKGRTVHYYNGS